MIEVVCYIVIKKNNRLFVDQVRIDLLLFIQQTGSLQAASRKLDISYQHAWNIIKEMNTLSDTPLVIKQRGGVNGGGTSLTPSALRVIDEYEQIQKETQSFSRKINTEIKL
jgi:molybdate transport system regulatory protein